MKSHSFAFRMTQYLMAVFLISCFFAACKDNEMGSPVITQVRVLDPAKKDSVFTQAYPGTLIAVQGENLGSATRVLFNDLEAAFNPTYNTNQTLIISIPDDVPTEATQTSVSNTLKVITTHGETSYSFTLLPPPPVISSVYNENGLPGSVMKIKGSNFYLVQKVSLPGNVDVTNFTVSEDARQIELTIPESAATSGPLSITTKFGEAKSPMNVFVSTGNGVVSNFDDLNNLEWGCSTSDDAAAFPGGKGKFAVLEFGSLAGGNAAWWDAGRSINTFQLQLIDTDKMSEGIGNYSLKFEIYIKKEWTAGSLIILRGYDWTYTARYAPWSTGDNSSASTYTTTAGWHTVTIPLTDFKTTKDEVYAAGNPASSLSQLLGGDSGKTSLHFFFVNDGTTTSPSFLSAIDNIRIVRNNP